VTVAPLAGLADLCVIPVCETVVTASKGQPQAWETIRDLRSPGKSILLTTHYVEAHRLADRVAILGRYPERGRNETGKRPRLPQRP
jgi:ABC-type uncharacterized transport system ATPase subunit